jgi:hypothetical protein
MLPFRSWLVIEGRPCPGRRSEFRAPPSVRSPPTFRGGISEGSTYSHCENGILDQAWVRDINGAMTVQVIIQYIRIWDLLLDFALTDTPDRFIWKWAALGEFFLASAYRALFFGRSPLRGAPQLRKTQALGRVHYFCWLVLHGRCWTFDRLRRHGLSYRDVCTLCTQGFETLAHLLLGCVHSWET